MFWRPARWIEHSDTNMSNQIDIPIVRDAPTDTPVGQELFPVMAVLLAQVLDLDHSTKESSL
jgi:hypothetical protein